MPVIQEVESRLRRVMEEARQLDKEDMKLFVDTLSEELDAMEILIETLD